jgi:hypothetical protein
MSEEQVAGRHCILYATAVYVDMRYFERYLNFAYDYSASWAQA